MGNCILDQDRRDTIAAKKAAEQARKAKARVERVSTPRLIPDPSMSPAEYFHQRLVRSGPNVGKVVTMYNMREYVGGLANLKDASEMQIMAAAKYRNIYDRAQIGGARAMDYAAVKVDTSGPSGDGMRDATIDAVDEYQAATQFLGMVKSSVIERVIVHDQSLTFRGMAARARERAKVELFAALDDLAVHFKLITKRAA